MLWTVFLFYSFPISASTSTLTTTHNTSHSTSTHSLASLSSSASNDSKNQKQQHHIPPSLTCNKNNSNEKRLLKDTDLWEMSLDFRLVPKVIKYVIHVYIYFSIFFYVDLVILFESFVLYWPLDILHIFIFIQSFTLFYFNLFSFIVYFSTIRFNKLLLQLRNPMK